MDERPETIQTPSPAGGAFTVVVRGGLHDGTSIALTEGTYAISANPESALCLQDDKLEGQKSLVLYKGRAALVQPHELEEKLQLQKVPCQFMLGEATLEVTSRDSHRLLAMPYVPIAAALILATFGFGILFLKAGDTQDADSLASADEGSRSLVSSFLDERSTSERTPPIQEQTNHQNSPKEQIMHAKDAFEPLVDPVEALRQRLRDVGINDRLDIDLAEGSLRIQGTVDQDAADQLKNVQSWYDENFSRSLVAQWDIDIGDELALPPISIESIWFSGHPHIIANGGQRYFEGSTFGAGWTVITISSDNIVLSNQGKETVIEFNSLRKQQEAAQS